MACVRIPQGQPLPPGPGFDTLEECTCPKPCTQNNDCCQCKGRILWRCDKAQECINLGGRFDDFDNVCGLGGDVYGDCVGLVLDDPQCQGGGQGPSLEKPPYCSDYVASLEPKGANPSQSTSFYSYGGYCCDQLCQPNPCCPQERICGDSCCPEGFYCNNGTCLTTGYYCWTRYACDGNGNCSANPNGTYTTLQECQNNYRNCILPGPGTCSFRIVDGTWNLNFSTCPQGYSCVDPYLYTQGQTYPNGTYVPMPCIQQ